MASTSQAPETENKPPLYCVGCSKDITNVPADRRSLQSAASDHVVQTWKALLERVLSQREVDIHIDVDSLLPISKWWYSSISRNRRSLRQ